MSERAHRLLFTKMHGIGNDFVVIDGRKSPVVTESCVMQTLADRHRGVGCDQILVIEPPRSEHAIASYRIWNADGSLSQQCGNGARCVAAWLFQATPSLGRHLVIDSPIGPHAVDDLGDQQYAVAMGCPIFDPTQIPLIGFARSREEYALQVQGEPLRLSAVSLGNPHAVIEVAQIHAAPVARLGPVLQHHPAFPEGVNVGFVQVIDQQNIQLRVFERGAGETLACGSGACAAAVALMQRRRIDRQVTVALPGGQLRVSWPSHTQSIQLSGPAEFVFNGEWFQ